MIATPFGNPCLNYNKGIAHINKSLVKGNLVTN